MASKREDRNSKRIASDSDNITASTMDSDDQQQKQQSKKKKHSSSSKSRKRSSSSSSKRRRYSDESDSDSDSEPNKKHGSSSKRRKRSSSSSKRRRYSDESESESGSGSESEEDRRRRKRKKREEKEKKRKKEKERKKNKEKSKKKEKGKIGAVTSSWGKYGIVREVDMWNKRPEFTAWLAEVKKVNLESLPNWEEKKMFKEYMEDYNTGTFPSKKYYDLDTYHKNKMEKEFKKGFKKVVDTERTVFNDEEQRRQEMMQVREKQKEQEVEALKDAMKSGMAQAMIEQARLKEEMAYLFKIGNTEAATAIQKKLDPDVPM